MKCMMGIHVEKGIYQHRCVIILPKSVGSTAHVLVACEGPPLVRRLLCLPLRQHLGNVSVAPGLRRILLPGCGGGRQGRDDGSL